MSMPSAPTAYPARLQVDRPEQHNRMTTLFRLFTAIPIAIVYGALTAGVTRTVTHESGQTVTTTSGGVASGLFVATVLMILFRQRYPRWWFDFARELARFGARVGAYLALLRDEYPSTVEEQAVHLEIDYPDAERDLNRWLPLVKWLLAIPHYIVLVFLTIGAFFAVVIGWFAILIPGGSPKPLFAFVGGVGRWWLGVGPSAFLLSPDPSPPFSLS